MGPRQACQYHIVYIAPTLWDNILLNIPEYSLLPPYPLWRVEWYRNIPEYSIPIPTRVEWYSNIVYIAPTLWDNILLNIPEYSLLLPYPLGWSDLVIIQNILYPYPLGWSDVVIFQNILGWSDVVIFQNILKLTHTH